jgi:ADP-ribosylglycohydrolase
VNNALICVASLFYGHMAPDQSVFQAVMCGLDTDCNGATVGSIVGAISGYAAYPDKLKAPLNDTIKPQMFGFENARMRDLAERTLAVNKQLRANGVI